jgi:hypothetical protein
MRTASTLAFGAERAVVEHADWQAAVPSIPPDVGQLVVRLRPTKSERWRVPALESSLSGRACRGRVLTAASRGRSRIRSERLARDAPMWSRPAFRARRGHSRVGRD